MAGFGRGQQWRSLHAGFDDQELGDGIVTLIGPVLVTPDGLTSLMLKTHMECPICHEVAHAILASLSDAGSLFAYCHRSSDGLPSVCARRFIRQHESHGLLIRDYRL